MRSIILAAALLLPISANAQSPQEYEPTAVTVLKKAIQCENIATQQFKASQEQIAALTKQVTDLTKERDDLKTKTPPAQ